MSTGINVTLAAALVLGTISGAFASDDHGKARHRHRHGPFVQQVAPVAPPAEFGGGRLVLHPRQNIACDTRGRGSRLIPCDQPVWVYGSVCEVDEGEGFFHDCGEAPGTGKYSRWRNR